MSRAVGRVGLRVAATGNWAHGKNAGALLLLLLSITACGGGQSSAPPSSPSAPAAPTPPPASPPPAGRGTLVISVTDALGAPIAGAEVWINSDQPNEDKYAYTDSTGRVEVRGVRAGPVEVRAWNADALGSLPRVTVPTNGTQSVTLVATPSAGGRGITAATVLPGGVSEDGRTLEFAVSILQTEHPLHGEFWIWGPDEVRVMACVPDPANDVGVVRPDCVAGAEGFDAAYSGVNEGRATSIRRVVAQPYDASSRPTFKTMVLLDQSATVTASDPEDKRLFATKFLLTRAEDKRLFALAAFADDDPVSGQPALLPQKPVTLLPVENPQFTSDGRALFPAVDSLAALEGGSAPVLAAIDRMLDFGAAGREEVASLIVVTDGRDTTCGTASQCRARRDELWQKGRDKGVRIVTVGLARSRGDWDREALAFAAQAGSSGATFWASDPRQLAPIFDIAERYARNEADSLQVSFRIQSNAAGTFVPGRTILGQVGFELCPMDCSYTYVPFAVTIR